MTTQVVYLLSPLRKAKDDVKKEVIYVVYEPDVLDAHNQWASAETIRKAAENFNQNLQKGNVKPNLFHDADDEGNYTSTEAFSIIKSWINECECLVGEEVVKEGTWLAKIKFHSDFLWDKFLDGTVGGVSIGALGIIEKPEGQTDE